MFSADLGGYTPSLPAATDPPFQKVALLLHGDGTNGAQNNTFVDYSYPGGYAVSFDGSGDYLQTSGSVSLSGSFTIEGWINLSSAQANWRMLCGQSIGSSGQYLSVTSSGLEMQFSAGVSTIASCSFSFVVGTWYHVAVVRNGTTVTFYVDGVAKTTANSTQSATFVTSYVGVGYSTSYVFNGFISNFRINTNALYTSNFTPSNQPLTAVSGTQLLTCQSATIVDNSPNAFTITANGNAAAVSSKTITRTGNVAQGTFSPFSLPEGQWSNYFDGTGDYLVVPSNSGFQFGLGDFTIEGWFCKTSSVNCRYFTFSDNQLNLDSNASNNLSTYGPSGLYTTTPLSIGVWYHVAITRNSGTARLFVNGALVSSTASSENYSGTRNFNLAVNQYANNDYFPGYISNVRLVKGTAVYTSNFTPSTTPLTAITNTSLLTCQSNRFKDNSSNNFTITPSGDTKVTAFSPFAPSAAYSASTNGGSGYFDGTGDYLDTPVSSSFAVGTGNFTAEAFTYLTALPGNNVNAQIFDYRFGGGGTGWQFAWRNEGGVLKVIVGEGGTVFTTITTSVVVGEWVHIAVVRNSSNGYVYINGVQVGSSFSWTSNYGSNLIRVGGYGAGANSITGYLTNARFTTSALYTTTFTPPTAPLTAVSGTQLLLNCTNAGIIDNAGKNDIETVGNAQISTSVVKYGTGSMYFDGTGDYLKMPSNEALKRDGDFTVEAWVYPTSVSSDRAVAGMYVSGVGGWVFYISGGYLWLSSGFNNYSSTGVCVSANQWQHIAAVISNGNLYLFVDGVQKNTTTNVSASNWSILRPLVVGSADNGSIWPFIGYIDDLRITKGQALYTSNFTPPTQAFPDV